MKILMSLVNRNRKLFFRDKGMLVSAMITPIILIVLYATFLAKVYRDSFLSNMPETLPISDKLINGTVAGQLAAALLAVSCVTVTFCVNLTMVQDRVYGSRRDFEVSTGQKTNDISWIFLFNGIEFPDGQYGGIGRLLRIRMEDGMVSSPRGCGISDCGYNFAGIVWYCFIKRCLLSFENTRTDVSCWNRCERRIWIRVWSIYANFKLW